MIIVLALIARTFLAAIFALAGIAKLRDFAGARHALAEFGAPPNLAGPFAVILVLTELIVSVALLPAVTASGGALAALLLLVLFTVVIAVNLSRGRAPQCHCFGQVQSTPISWKTIVRNLMLSGVAVVAWAGSRFKPPSMVNWIIQARGAGLLAIATGATALGLGITGLFFFLYLMRAYGRLVLRVDALEASLAAAGVKLSESSVGVGLAPGTPIPAFTLTEALTERLVTGDELLSRQLPILLIFTSPGCEACKALLPEIAEWQRTHSDRALVAMSSNGNRNDVRTEAAEFGLKDVFVDGDSKVERAFQVTATPSAVLIWPGAKVGSYLAEGRDAILHLVEDVLQIGSAGSLLTPGMPVPSLELQLLGGEKCSLHESLLGADSVLLFWNSACYHCQSMRQDLRDWEVHSRQRSNQLVVVSSGDTESSRTDGFASPVFLDPELRASTAFGAGGTPMAIRVDSGGHVASPLAAGPAAVLRLLGATPRSRNELL
jgi:thiol-disulfide isomerase/thioredoxin